MSGYLTRQELDTAMQFVRSKIDFPVQAGLVLGSGLGNFAESISDPFIIPFEQIPFFPKSTVPGHSGKFYAGFIQNTSVLAMQGRVHYYEGHHISKVGMGIRIMSELGIRQVILTNAAGSVNTEYKPGDYMIIADHLNLLGTHPLIGPNDESFGPRFVDQSHVYSQRLIGYARECAQSVSIQNLREGVYAAMSGPTYETPAEIRMLRTLGADAVGMSTVPEAIVARHCDMQVLGISLITNFGAGISTHDLHHSEVMDTANLKNSEFKQWLTSILSKIDEE